MKRIALTLLFAALFLFCSANNSPLEGGQGGVVDDARNLDDAAGEHTPLTPLKGGTQKKAIQNDDGYPRQPQFDVLHYDLALALSDTSNVIWGEAKLNIKIRSIPSAKNLRLDLKEMTIARVSVEQYDSAFDHQSGALNVPLPAHAQSGDTLDLAISYHGEPKDGLIIANNKFGRRSIFADNWPDRASYWFPSIDHPSDKSTVSFHLTLPAHYTVIANGRLNKVHEQNRDNKTWQWSEPVPIPTYCMVFGAADFTVIPIDTNAATPISYYVFPEDAPYAHQNFGRVPEMLQFFTARFGAYPFGKLVLVQSSTRYGGMENASAIFFAERSLGKDRNIEGTTAHEIAHQWFGDSATEADWRHLWLSEGFATYGEALFFGHVDGVEKFRENMSAKRESYFKFARQPRGPILDTTITNYMALLNPNNYAKAGWVLHMLRDVVGEEAFWRGVQSYYARYQKSNALTQDFRAVMEEASGTSLHWFFRQWLEQPDYPQARAQWRWLAAHKQVELELLQTQAHSFYRLPITIALQTGAHVEKHQIWMNEREQKFRLRANRPPEHVVFDPEVKLLMIVDVIKAGKSD